MSILLCFVFLFGVSIGNSVTFSTNNGCVGGNDIQPKHQPPVLKLFNVMHNHLSLLANKPVEQVSRREYHLGAAGGGLTDSDRELLASIYFNSSSVFEFGLGESTHIAAYVGVPRYSGVDNDPVWIGKARDGAKMDHFRFSFADTGKTSDFGHPINDKMQKIPLDYQSAPLNNEYHAFDFYLVDGRYRVATACSSFLHAISRGGDMSQVLVGVHDWVSDRSYLFELTSIADVVHQSARLAVLRMKTHVSEHDIHELWKSHIWDRN